MATSYALPTSMHNGHSHHGHNHVHSHSHASSRPAANTRSMRHERSSGSLHSSSFSESSVEHNHIHDHKHKHAHNHTHSHHSHEPSPLGLGYPTPPNSDSLPGQQFEKHAYESSPELYKVDSYEPPPNAVDVVGHNHTHHHHSSPSAEPRSKFTTFVLPYTRRWPLLYTIMADKDSRRIFYFMRCVLPIKVLWDRC
jgi:zinc transporter 5/7